MSIRKGPPSPSPRTKGTSVRAWSRAPGCQPKIFAAVDLGSNSFHLVVARLRRGELEIVDRLQVAAQKGGEAKVQASIDEQIAGQTIEFDVGSASISSRGVALLDRLLPILHGAAQTRVEIGGHTDNTGDPTYNLDLSRRRAMAVQQYLISRGVDEKRLTAVGYGQEKPIADNNTPQGQLKNRRIEFKILKGE